MNKQECRFAIMMIAVWAINIEMDVVLTIAGLLLFTLVYTAILKEREG